MNKHWALTLREKGFAGVTFSKRSDVKFALRPVPYYEVDGNLEILEEIKNELFKYGINSTITEAKYFNSLHVTGVSNCIVLSEVLNIKDNWANSLRDDFQKGTHLTEKGIKKLFFEFGKKSLLTYSDVCEIIDAAKEKRLDEVLQRVMSKQKKLTKLPEYDDLYKKYNIKDERCMCCNAPQPKIYFIGKYPRADNIFLLCKDCAAAHGCILL